MVIFHSYVSLPEGTADGDPGLKNFCDVSIDQVTIIGVDGRPLQLPLTSEVTLPLGGKGGPEDGWETAVSLRTSRAALGDLPALKIFANGKPAVLLGLDVLGNRRLVFTAAVGQHAICTLAQMKEDEYVITCHNIIITSYNICTWKLSQTNNVWEWCWESVRLPKHDMEEALAARHVQRDPELQWESCAVQICRARHSSKASQLPWVSSSWVQYGAIWVWINTYRYHF